MAYPFALLLSIPSWDYQETFVFFRFYFKPDGSAVLIIVNFLFLTVLEKSRNSLNYARLIYKQQTAV